MTTSIVDQAYEMHRERLFGQLLAVTRDAASAEDVLHESFMRLLHEVQAGRAPRNPRAWLYRVGHNLVVSRARRRQVAARFVEQLPAPQVLPSAALQSGG